MTRVVFQLVGDEIVATGLRWETGVAILGFVMWWNHSAFSNLLALARHAQADTSLTAGRAWATAAVSILGPPVRFLPGFIRNHAARGPFFLFQALLASLWLAVLAYTSYPDLDDFRARFITIFVVTAVHVSVLGLIAVAFARERRWAGGNRVSIAAVLLVIGIAWGFRPMHEGTLVLHEYARFGYVVKRHGLGEWFRPRDRLGLEPTAQRFVYHDPEADRYRAQPALTRLPPIVMILWDAARPDRMGCYGYSRVKHAIVMDGAKTSHWNYVGDSILGFDVNLGAGVKLSNKKITNDEIRIRDINGTVYQTGLQKLGAIIGDGTQIGCNAVLNPGMLLGKRCLVYPLTSVRRTYFHNEVIRPQ